MGYTIIGSSAAGLTALEKIRSKDTESDISVITADNKRPHSRILTSYLIGEEISEEDIFLRSSDYFSKMQAEIFANEKVTNLKIDKKEVKLDSGKKIDYDKLLIATGGTPKVPDYEGVNLEGVFTLRDYNDVKAIKNYLNEDIEHCFLFGGGLVGMKAAEAFHNLGKKITIIIRSPQVLSQMLDEKSAKIVENYLKEKGINILKGESPKKIKGENSVKGVELESGKELEGDLVLIGKGVSPNTDFISDQIELNKYGGIVVNQKMETNVPDIYAAGDVVSAPDFLSEEKTSYAIWPDAVWQAKVAAKNMVGNTSNYEGGLNLNALKVIDLLFFAIGKVQLNEKEKEKYDIYQKYEVENNVYRKIVFSNERIVGAITIGESSDIGALYHLIKKKTPIKNKAEKIVEHGVNYAELVKDKYLLREIRQEVPLW